MKKQKHILLIEDDKFQAKFFGHILEKVASVLGCKVSSISNGEQALKILQGKESSDFKLNELSLIVLDWLLPDVSRLQILKEIKKQKIKAPVIVLSASSGPELIVKAIKAGAEDYIIKGKEGESDRLFNAIEKLI